MEKENQIVEQLKFHLDSAKKLAETLSIKWGIPQEKVMEMIIRSASK